MTDNLSKEPDALLLKIIDNYTDALNRISLEQTNADDFDEHFKDIKRQTSEAIQQHYVSKVTVDAIMSKIAEHDRYVKARELYYGELAMIGHYKEWLAMGLSHIQIAAKFDDQELLVRQNLRAEQRKRATL